VNRIIAPELSVFPVDDKEDARLIVSQIILGVLNGLKMAYPRTTAKRRRELKSIGKHL
jgi:hypothetical protein